MKTYILATLVVLSTILSCSDKNKSSAESTTYYFIRHAEKDRTDKSNKNPDLTQKGIMRSEKWSLIFDNVKFDNVYSTDYNRTIQTAKPTANKNDLEIKFYNPDKLFSKDFAADTRGQSTLVVGHSNTTPAFVNAVLDLQKYKDIEDDNNANLYIVRIAPSGEKSDVLLVID